MPDSLSLRGEKPGSLQEQLPKVPRAGCGAFQQGAKSGGSESGPDGASVPATARGCRNKGEMWIEAKCSPWGSTNLQPLGNLSDTGRWDWETSSRVFCLCWLLCSVGKGGLESELAERVGPQPPWAHAGLPSLSPLCPLGWRLLTREWKSLGSAAVRVPVC